MDLPAGMWGQAVSEEEHPCWCWAGSFHPAEISAAKQVLCGLTLLMVYQGSVQYRLASPGAADGGRRKSSVSALTFPAL